MTFVEALPMGAVVLFVSLQLYQSLNVSKTEFAKIDSRYDMAELDKSIDKMMNSPSVCKTNLLNKIASSTQTLPSITSGTTTIAQSTAAQLASPAAMLRIRSITLTGYVDLATPVPITTGGNATIAKNSLTFVYKIGNKDLTRSIPLISVVNGGNIKSCYMERMYYAVKENCTFLGGVLKYDNSDLVCIQQTKSYQKSLADLLTTLSQKTAELQTYMDTLKVKCNVTSPARLISVATCNILFPMLCCGSTKKTTDCTAAGGTTYPISSGNYICSMTATTNSCPGGWANYQNWGAQGAKITASGTSCGNRTVNPVDTSFANLPIYSENYACINSPVTTTDAKGVTTTVNNWNWVLNGSGSVPYFAQYVLRGCI